MRSKLRTGGRTRLGVLTLLGALLFAGCADGGQADDEAASMEAAAGAFPVTIESRWGSQTIDSEPARVVTLDNQATDAALALGVVPVGIPLVTFVPGGMQAWTQEALRGKEQPEQMDMDQGIPFEKVAALEPDVILGTNAWQLDEQPAYETISRIAPTVHFTDFSLGDSWQVTTRRIGRALGRAAEAEALVSDLEAELAEVRRRTPELEGRTVNMFNADPGGLYAISSPDDYSMQFLALLGLRLSPEVDQLRDEFPSRAPISEERYDVLESDLLVGTSVSQEALEALDASAVFGAMDVVRDGRYLPLDIGAATSMAYPSVLSIRWALDNVIPSMEAAIRKL